LAQNLEELSSNQELEPVDGSSYFQKNAINCSKNIYKTAIIPLSLTKYCASLSIYYGITGTKLW